MSETAMPDGEVPGRDTPHARALLYRRKYGLDAHVQPGNGRVFVRADRTLIGFTMPHRLGIEVRNRLQGRFGNAGPVIDHPRSGRWTILAAPRDLDLGDLLLDAEMYRACVHLAKPNAEIMLPSPADSLPDAYRVWKNLPSDNFRNSGGHVLALIRECLAARRGC